MFALKINGGMVGDFETLTRALEYYRILYKQTVILSAAVYKNGEFLYTII